MVLPPPSSPPPQALAKLSWLWLGSLAPTRLCAAAENRVRQSIWVKRPFFLFLSRVKPGRCSLLLSKSIHQASLVQNKPSGCTLLILFWFSQPSFSIKLVILFT